MRDPSVTTTRQRGTVRMYRADREFGFICPDDGSTDIFVHGDSVLLAGLKRLSVGQRVEFEKVTDNRGFQAHYLALV